MVKPRKIVQFGIRLQADDILAITEIAEWEELSNSEVVRFLIRWGTEQYKTIGSLRALELTSLADLLEKRKAGKHLTLELKEEKRQSDYFRPKRIRVR